MQMLLNSLTLTHGINIWFDTRVLGTICKHSPHLDPQMDA